jgi:F-box protein 18 (helicase)
MSLLEQELGHVPTTGPSRPPTPEQSLILDVALAPGELLKVVAYAGTGKTTVLQMYSDRHAEKDYCYLAFNKSVETEAKQRFDRHVLCKTVHALAYSVVGHRYAKTGRLAGSIPNWQIAKALRIPVYDSTIVAKTLETFLNSAEATVDLKHVEPDHLNRLKPDYQGAVIDGATAIWEAVQNRSHGFDMTHSGYLKLYQLSKPVIPGHIIMLDEAQDTNPVTHDLVFNQLQWGKSVIIVGDPYQQIYAWRGAENSMNKVEAKQTLYLTKSWRFPQGVADVANVILNRFFGETVPLQGVDRELETWGPTTVGTTVTRTNSEIFRQVATLAQSGRPFHVIGREAFYQLLDSVMDVFHLYTNKRQNILDQRIKRHNTYQDLKGFAEDTLDMELSARCRIVEEYLDSTPEIVRRCRELYTSAAEGLPVYVTCHKAKGLEWNNVALSEDFNDLYDEHGKLRPAIPSDEVNLYYVAATRAKRALKLNQNLRRLTSAVSVPNHENP